MENTCTIQRREDNHNVIFEHRRSCERTTTFVPVFASSHITLRIKNACNRIDPWSSKQVGPKTTGRVVYVLYVHICSCNVQRCASTRCCSQLLGRCWKRRVDAVEVSPQATERGPPQSSVTARCMPRRISWRLSMVSEQGRRAIQPGTGRWSLAIISLSKESV